MRDSDVRLAVRRELARTYGSDETTRIVEEMGVWSGTVRIDIAVINGELSGIELKSDSDTLERLPMQADIYSRVFDRLTLVVGSRHLQQAMDTIPTWWGVVVASIKGSDACLTSQRNAGTNPSPDPYLIAQLLWKSEAIDTLERFHLATGWRAKRIKLLHERLANNLPVDVLRSEVRGALKRRAGWLGDNRTRQLDMPIDADSHPML